MKIEQYQAQMNALIEKMVQTKNCSIHMKPIINEIKALHEAHHQKTV